MKLCTGVSSVVRFARPWAVHHRALGCGDGIGAFGGRGGFVVVDEQDWGQGLFMCQLM